MTKQTKIILGIVLGLVVLCGIACLVGVLGFGLLGRSVASNVKTSPADASKAAGEVADFTVPAGFSPSSSLHILGMTMVVYENGSSAIVLVQMPTGGEITETTILQMQQAMERQTGRQLSNVHTVDSRQLTIRGKPAQETIQEGTNSSGEAFRQMMVAFQGKSGVAMMMVMGPASSWNQAEYDQMVRSIH